MPTASVRVAYRPLRVAFLVRPDDVEDHIRAATWATWIWGGIRCPMIPLLDEPDAIDRLIREWNADVLAPALATAGASGPEDHGAAEQAQAVVDRHRHLSWPERVDHLGLLEPIGDRQELGAVDVRLPISHLWEEEYRHREESIFVLPSWRADDPLAPLFSILFGDYGSAEPAPRLRRSYREGLLARHVRIGEGVPAEFVSQWTPIHLTGIELHRFGDRLRGDGIFVGNPSTAHDLRQFWNLRARGHIVAFLPEEEASERLNAFVAAHIEHMPPQEFDFFGTVWRSRPWEAGEELPIALAPHIPESAQLIRDYATDASVARAERDSDQFSTDSETVLASVEDSEWRTEMVFALPPRRPFPASRFESYFAHWAVSVEPLGEYSYEPKTLRMPALPDLNEWAAKEMTARLRGVRLQRESTDFLLAIDENTLQIGLVDQAEVVRRVFARAGIDAKPSGAGEVADRIIRQMGGLQSCRIFRAPGVRDLLASDKPYSEDEVLQALRAGGGLDEVPRAKTETEAFDLLLDREALRPALRLKCPECGIWRLFVPDAIGQTVQCPGCGASIPLARHLRKPPGQKQRYSWRFQRSGLLAERGHGGAIPVILTMLRLSNTLSSGRALFLLSSHDLGGDGINCESDLLALEIDMHGKPALAVAEVKGRDARLEERDVSNLEVVAERIRESGLTCYLIFATTGDWEEEELELFRAYVDRHRTQVGYLLRPAPILLSRSNLERWEIYGDDRDTLAKPHVMSIADLATNSEQLHFRSDGDETT